MHRIHPMEENLIEEDSVSEHSETGSDEGAKAETENSDSTQLPSNFKPGGSMNQLLLGTQSSSLETVPSRPTAAKVQMGEKGRLIRQQKKKRKGFGERDYFAIMTDRYFDGNVDRARSAVERFNIANASESTRHEATGMLKILYDMGAKRAILTSVFKIGGYRYDRLKKISEPRAKYQNINAVTEEQIEQLSVTRKLIPIADEGYACNHREHILYIGDEDITSIAKLWEKYYMNEPSIKGKKMAQETFRKYWNVYHSDIKFRKLKEDECDICIQFKIGE